MLTGAARRRVFGEYQSSEPSRFIDEVPAELVERLAPSFSSAGRIRATSRTTSSAPTRTAAAAGGRVEEDAPAYAYEDEDQSTGLALRPACACGIRSSASATVISVEPLDDDTKLVVRFAAVGQKTLRAKFARLELA